MGTTGSDKSFRKSTLGAAKGQQTKGPSTVVWEASQQVVAAEQVSKRPGTRQQQWHGERWMEPRGAEVGDPQNLGVSSRSGGEGRRGIPGLRKWMVGEYQRRSWSGSERVCPRCVTLEVSTGQLYIDVWSSGGKPRLETRPQD